MELGSLLPWRNKMTQQECASIVLIMIQIFGGQVCFVGEGSPHHVANNYVREIQIIKGINKNNKFYDTEDVGCKEEWDKEIVKSKAQGYKVIRYRNKYEPDSYPSYLVFEEGITKIIERNAIHSSEMEEEIDRIFIN